MAFPKWKKYRKSFYGSDQGQNVFKVALHGDVEDTNGRYWMAARTDGSLVLSSELHLPYEGIHRFESLKAAKWFLEVNDQ